jgi:GDPmannose 4,6-dehydratase
VCSGILFNHESPRRGEHFVTRKITISLAKIRLGLQDQFSLGNVDAKRDWGFAGDYVKAMHAMLQGKKADDYVIGTGVMHTVRQFVEAAAHALDMHVSWKGRGLKEVGYADNGKKIITIDKKFYRPTEVHGLLADARKARMKLQWKPKVSFEELAEMMALSDLKRLETRPSEALHWA